ncbi:MAG: alpha-ribazole phosphatase [Flavobacteriaceae bacterium]|jgi:alpha-ribazole phosphatase|nr:alpha-ribazole phosphatase [Flavobacteriaceae bacterium]
MELYIIRHTPVDIESGICYGQTDLNLLNTYPDDVAIIKKKLPEKFSQIISSPLKRCTFIAEEFSSYYTTDNRLQEMDFGAWELQAWNKINSQELEQWMNNIVDVKPPHGENLTLVYQRVVSFLEELRKQPYEKVLLVAHAGIIRCIWTYILKNPLQTTFKIPVGYGEVFHVNLGITTMDDFIVQKQ